MKRLGRGAARGPEGPCPLLFCVAAGRGGPESLRRGDRVLNLAQAVPAGGAGQPSWLIQIAPLVFIFVIFYFLMIRPARRRQRDVQRMIDALKAGDRVITSGGLLGTVAAVDRNVVQLRIADKVKVDVTKSSIVGLQDPGTAPPAET